jgi:hypothetical protein
MVAPAGDEPDAQGVAPSHEPVAVVLDLVQPRLAGRRLRRLGRQTWRDEAGRERQREIGGSYYARMVRSRPNLMASK